MYTCPPSEQVSNQSLEYLEGTSLQPGTLFLSGSLALNAVIIFIRQSEKDRNLEPYAFATDIDMKTLVTITEFPIITNEATVDITHEVPDSSNDSGALTGRNPNINRTGFGRNSASNEISEV